ncbi:MAG: peptide deformylase [Verrucomicrobiia bacterium]
MKIVKYGDPILRTRGKRITTITPEVKALAADMVQTMREANGIGLAAQQVGKALQLCVVDLSLVEDAELAGRIWINGAPSDLKAHMPLILVNPELTPVGKLKETATEGCLSFPEIFGDVSRLVRVKVSAIDLEENPLAFEADGLLARAIQHEHDHLHGILFIDRMDSATKASLASTCKKLKKQTESERRSTNV